MKKWMLPGLAAVIVIAGVLPSGASGDPVETRKSIMQSVGAAAGLGGAMMKGEVDYSPAAGKAAIAAMDAAAHAFGAFFPEGTETGDTTASPAIWSDAAGFEAQLAKLQAVTGAAMKASGRSGPSDLEAFKAVMGPVMGACRSCHEGYRVKR